TTTVADTGNATVDNVAPTVTDANVSISGATGTGGAFKIGDTVTATWTNVGGDANADISGVTFDFSAFGGGTAVAATNVNGVWTASYTLVAGSIDATSRNVSATVTDNAGNTATAADTTNATVDNVSPTVTDGHIGISGATGTGGAFKIGDTVTAAWTNTAQGDNNTDISGVTFDFSAFGGGAAVAATNVNGVWTASYTLVAGGIDLTNRNVSATVTDDAGNTTTMADTSNATVNNVAPTVTDANVSISGASGSGGTYKIGDTVTATWTNVGGENNADTISGVTFDFSQFGGGSAVAATNVNGVWTASYTLVAGGIDLTNRNVTATVTDDAGNTATTADTSNATVDNVAPTVTDANVSISGGSGTGGAYKIGDTVTATWTNASGDANADTISGVTFDFSQFGGGSAVAATSVNGVWTATYTLVAGSIDATSRNVSATVTDNAGNTTTVADTGNATVDNVV
ncbi:beta strand repeat-containing protein, partial [Azohydromonas lata]